MNSLTESQEYLLLVTEHLFNLPYASVPTLVSHDDPVHPLPLHLVNLPPHQPHHGYQVHPYQGLHCILLLFTCRTGYRQINLLHFLLQAVEKTPTIYTDIHLFVGAMKTML